MRDMETGETKQHEVAESRPFEKKEDMGIVRDAADKRPPAFRRQFGNPAEMRNLRKNSLQKLMGTM
jgi:hypothetical protein